MLIVAFVLGKCKAYRAQAWLCNIAVIAPVNVVVVVLYYLLTPLRWCYSRTCNCCTTPMISLCEIHPSWKNSTFSSFMDAVVIGYKGCFGLTPDAPKPMPSILDMDQAEAAGYFQKLFKMKLFTCCAQYLDACCPMACRESLCCRVCTAYCSGVFCGWWLVGTIWVQPLRATAAPAPADAEAADADGGLEPVVRRSLLDWVAHVLEHRLLPTGAAKDWNAFERRDEKFAAAAPTLLILRGRPLPDEVPHPHQEPDPDQPLDLDVIVPVLDRYIRHHLRRSEHAEDQARARRLISRLRLLGIQVTE